MCGEIIGVIGTLTGTVLGWILNSLSQRGKLNIYTHNWGEIFEMLDGYGGLRPSVSKAESEFYNCHFDMDVYNSSINPKTMRSIKIGYFENDNCLFSVTPQDDDTRRVTGSVIRRDNIEYINISGKAVQVIHFTYGMNNSAGAFDLLFKSNKVYLTYRNEKNKLIKVFITEHNVEDFFDMGNITQY